MPSYCLIFTLVLYSAFQHSSWFQEKHTNLSPFGRRDKTCSKSLASCDLHQEACDTHTKSFSHQSRVHLSLLLHVFLSASFSRLAAAWWQSPHAPHKELWFAMQWLRWGGCHALPRGAVPAAEAGAWKRAVTGHKSRDWNRSDKSWALALTSQCKGQPEVVFLPQNFYLVFL